MGGKSQASEPVQTRPRVVVLGPGGERGILAGQLKHILVSDVMADPGAHHGQGMSRRGGSTAVREEHKTPHTWWVGVQKVRVSIRVVCMGLGWFS